MHPLTLLATLAVLPVPPVPTPDAFVDDVRKVAAAPDNDARFDVLAEMLRSRSIAFVVQDFELDEPAGSEPRTRGRNIVVSLGEGAEEIVVGAHYDAARLPDGSLSRGAVDNAASAVMLVHLAHALRDVPLATRLRVVWFDMEELGLVGSERYLQQHASDRIVAMLNFDINAYGETILYGSPEGGEDARLRRVFTEACASEDIDCVRFRRMPPGDDRSFGEAKIPTLSIATLPAIEVHRLWLMLHGGAESGLAPGATPAILRTIHTAEDVPAKVDGASVARVHRFALALVRRLGAAGR